MLVQNRAANARLEPLSGTDELTGLANRRTFLEWLEMEIDRQQRTGRPLLLAFVDLDHFKSLNDLHGHAAGDLALKQVAEIARARKTDTVARIGRDEFALAMPETEGSDGALTLARVQEALLELMRDRDWPVNCAASESPMGWLASAPMRGSMRPTRSCTTSSAVAGTPYKWKGSKRHSLRMAAL